MLSRTWLSQLSTVRWSTGIAIGAHRYRLPYTKLRIHPLVYSACKSWSVGGPGLIPKVGRYRPRDDTRKTQKHDEPEISRGRHDDRTAKSTAESQRARWDPPIRRHPSKER